MGFWRNLRFRRRRDVELDDEVRAYADMLTDEKIRAGSDPGAARREALMELGGVEQVKEEIREVRRGRWIENLAQDIRISARALAKNKTFTAFSVLMLMLGIGATTTVFSVFYSVLLKPLPFRDLDRIVELFETRLDRGWNRASFTAANFWDTRTLNRSFSEMAAMSWSDANLTGLDRPERVALANVTAGFFRALGIAPVLGRDFAYTEDRPGQNNNVVILSYRLWQRRFAADPKIAGKTIRLNDRACTVIGVLPPGAPWLNSADVFVPFVYSPNADRGSFEFAAIARLKPGVTQAAAQADMDSISARIASEFPRAKGMGIGMRPAEVWIAGTQTRRAMWILLGAVALLLLIACVNLANLLLARAAGRSREMAVRSALGASRARIASLALTESLLLCGAGAVLGLLLAGASVAALRASETNSIPRVEDLELNVYVLGFTLLVTLATGILSGLAPALQAPATALASVLHEGGRSSAGGSSRTQSRMRNFLVAGEVALSLVLLVGAGLLMRSFTQLTGNERGFDTRQRLFFAVNLPGSMADSAKWQTTEQYLERIRALPYVKSAAIVSQRPLARGSTGLGFGAPGQESSGREVPWASWRLISPAYFEALGVPLLSGRTFLPHETGRDKADRGVVVSRRVAELLYPGQDAIGRPITLWKGQGNGSARIIGVVADMRERGLDELPTFAVYLAGRTFGWQTWHFVVHTANAPMQAVPAMRSILAEINPTLPLYDVGTMEDLVSRSVAPQRFSMLLLATFAFLALLLAVAGVYGVLSYWLSRRTAEIGLRAALGAGKGEILRVAILQGMRPVVAGAVLGFAGAMMLARYMETLLYEVKPADPPTYAIVAVLVVLTALVSCMLPALRAARIDPAQALRSE